MLNIKFINPPSIDRRLELHELLNKKKAVYLSRLESYNELVVLIPVDGSFRKDVTPKYMWCWLDGDDGAYVDNEKVLTINECANTIIRGEWNIPLKVDVTITRKSPQ